MTETIIISSASELRSTVAGVMRVIKEREELTTEKEYDIWVCLREILSNSLIYSGCGNIRFVYEVEDNCFSFSVMDKGEGFRADAEPECPDVYSENGRGIFLVRKLADVVRYNKKGTAVIVRFFY